jgi:small subunit ribosomal protein S16
MLKIKLARFGKKKQPHYRIVINEARDKRDGKYVEAIGHYAPTMSPKILTIDMDKYNDWRKKGAQPTETVAALVTRYQSGTPFPPKAPRLSKKAKAKAEQAAAEAAAPKEAPAAETEAVEAAPEAPVVEATETTEAPQA